MGYTARNFRGYLSGAGAVKASTLAVTGAITGASFAGAVAATTLTTSSRVVHTARFAATLAGHAADDYNPSTQNAVISVLVLDNTTGANVNINSFTVVEFGQTMVIVNESGAAGETITIINEGTGTAINRFLCPSATNFAIPAQGGSVTLWSDPTTQRWRVMKES